MKERYQEIEEKNQRLQSLLKAHRLGPDFLSRFEMSWIYHDSALDGTVYTAQELQAALAPGESAVEASLLPILTEIRNHRAAVAYLREEARAGSKKQAQVTLSAIKRIHDLLSGIAPETQQPRGLSERREKSEKELAKEKEKAGFRKDMPLHRTYFHEIAQPAKIPLLLEKLVDFTASAEFREFHPIRQAATVHHQFLQIFPFTENSGKVARMCSNLILIRHGFLPCVIHSIDRQRYYESLKTPVASFRTLVMDALENSIDNGIKFFKDQSRRYRAIN